jgi:hypothetical protein
VSQDGKEIARIPSGSAKHGLQTGRRRNLAAKDRSFLFWRALLWVAGLVMLIKIAVSVAGELRSVPLGVMAAGLTLLLAVALWSSLTSRRR